MKSKLVSVLLLITLLSFPEYSQEGTLAETSLNAIYTYYGEISETTGRPKTVHVEGYYRKDGTYVKPHYRSTPRYI